MILKEWKDANGNKISSSSTTNNSPSNSSGSFKKRLNKLIYYADKYKYSKINKVEIKSLDDDAADFIEHYDDGGTIEYVIYINPVTEDWQLKVYTTDIYYKGKQTAHEASGTGWSGLLKELRYYVMIPTVGTPEYKELLKEWLDAKGNKVNHTSSLAPATTSSTSAKSQSQVKRYSKLLKQIDTDGLSTRRINKFNDTTLDITVNTAKRHDLNLRMEYQPVTDDYIFTVDGKTSKGWAWFEDILELLIIGGVIKNTNLCESASFADDFKLYENLWD